MYISRRIKVLLIGLLVVLNIVIRISSLPHIMYGFDAFNVKMMAQSISDFGEARYWINPLSIFGLYPCSYASAVYFVLSGLHQSIGVNMETVVNIYGIIIGVFSIFPAYLMAGMIRDNDLFKFLVAFCFSIAPGVLVFSTGDPSTRGFFLVLYPFFIYLLLKTERSVVRFSLLVVVLFVLLMATHHYFWFTLPVILSFLFVMLDKKLNLLGRYINSYVYILLFIILFFFPFFSYTFIEGSRYGWLQNILTTNVRYSGFIFMFALGGFFYLLLKKDKTNKEWFLLSILLLFAPLYYQKTYTHFVSIPFVVILVGVGLRNITKIQTHKKAIFTLLIVGLLATVVFSSFYQHWRTHTGEGAVSAWYMREGTYEGAIWLNENVEPGDRVVGNNLRAGRMNSFIGGEKVYTGSCKAALAYGMINESFIELEEQSPFSDIFYLEGPYTSPQSHSLGGALNWNYKRGYGYAESFFDEYNVRYIVEDTSYNHRLIQSLKDEWKEKNVIYDSGLVSVGDLGN